MNTLRTLSLLVAGLALAVSPAWAQRKMPKAPTPSVSTDPNAPKVVVTSSDFEQIKDMHLRLVGTHLHIEVPVNLLGTPSDYTEALSLRLWADFDNDRAFTPAELLMDEVRFAEDAVGGVVMFVAGKVLGPGQVFTDGTMLRAVLCYGALPLPEGHFPFGDVVDRSPPVQVIQPAELPTVAPGYPREMAPLQIVESHPGALQGELVLVSPKGTAISLTRTGIERDGGDIRTGRPYRRGDAIHIPIRRPSTVSSGLTVRLVMAIAGSFAGPVVIETNQDGQRAAVATVEQPAALVDVGGLVVITPGRDRDIGTVALVEGVAGQLSGDLVLVSPKGTAISLTRFGATTRRGDLRTGPPRLVAPNRIVVPVTGRSTVASRVEFSIVLDVTRRAPPFITIEAEPDTIQPRVAVVAFVWPGFSRLRDLFDLFDGDEGDDENEGDDDEADNG